jgi:hypothetical protein
MPRDFYPRREADIVRFTANFSAKINADAPLYGLTEPAAAEYAVLQQAFAQTYAVAQSPSTDTSSATAAKEADRVALERATRPLVRLIKANPNVTDEMRVNLGLSPQTQRRRRVPAPDAAPSLLVVGSVGGAVRVRLSDLTSLRRGKPRDVNGAVIFGHAGDNPPADPREWNVKAITSRATAQLHFSPNLPPGTKVWLTACWTNARQERGPLCEPVFTHLTYGVAVQRTQLRQAA